MPTDIYANVPQVYRSDIRAAAQSYGIPELALVNLLDIESDHFAPDVIAGKRKSSAGATGIAQFMPGTASGLGIDPTDPVASIYGAAKLLSQYGGGGGKPLDQGGKALTPDQLKVAVASYVSGPKTVQDAMSQAANNVLSGGEQDWTKVWPGLTNDANGVTTYLNRITSGIPTSGGSTATAGANGDVGSTFRMPQLQDFELIDPQTGAPTGRYDTAAYNKAMAEYRLYSSGQYGQQQQPGDSFASFLNAVVSNIGQQIEAGQLDVTKANSEFNRRMSAYDSASKNFNSMLGYAIPSGATQIPGTNIPITPGQVIEYNPFKEALDLVNSTPKLTDIPTPQVPGMDNIFQNALNLYRSGVTAGVVNPGTQPNGQPRGQTGYYLYGQPLPDGWQPTPGINLPGLTMGPPGQYRPLQPTTPAPSGETPYDPNDPLDPRALAARFAAAGMGGG